jgi:hypothetical protein
LKCRLLGQHLCICKFSLREVEIENCHQRQVCTITKRKKERKKKAKGSLTCASKETAAG